MLLQPVPVPGSLVLGIDRLREGSLPLVLHLPGPRLPPVGLRQHGRPCTRSTSTAKFTALPRATPTTQSSQHPANGDIRTRLSETTKIVVSSTLQNIWSCRRDMKLSYHIEDLLYEKIIRYKVHWNCRNVIYFFYSCIIIRSLYTGCPG